MFVDIQFPWQKKQEQSEYDTVYKWYEEKRDEVAEITKALEPFASVCSESGMEADTALQLARNARDLLHASTATIKRQAMENEQLLDQLDTANREIEEVKQDRRGLYSKLTAEIERLNTLVQQQTAVIETYQEREKALVTQYGAEAVPPVTEKPARSTRNRKR